MTANTSSAQTGGAVSSADMQGYPLRATLPRIDGSELMESSRRTCLLLALMGELLR